MLGFELLVHLYFDLILLVPLHLDLESPGLKLLFGFIFFELVKVPLVTLLPVGIEALFLSLEVLFHPFLLLSLLAQLLILSIHFLLQLQELLLDFLLAVLANLLDRAETLLGLFHF